MAAPFAGATGNLVFAMNASLLASLVLSGVGTYLLARRVGVRPFGAMLAGLIFVFASTRFSRLGHLHLTTIQWVPFFLAFLYRYFETGRRRDLSWACVFFGLQVATSGHGTMYAALGALGLVLWRISFGPPIRSVIRTRDLWVTVLPLAAVVALFFWPYLLAQSEVGLVRPLGESAYFSPNAASYISSFAHLHRLLLSFLPASLSPAEPIAFIFPGFLPLGFALLALATSLAGWRSSVSKAGLYRLGSARVLEVLFILVGGATAMLALVDVVRAYVGVPRHFTGGQLLVGWMSCGALAVLRLGLIRQVPLDIAGRIRRLWPLFGPGRRQGAGDPVYLFGVISLVSLWLSVGPTFLLYRLVHQWPGFSLIRVPSRFALLSLLGLAIMAAIGFERLIQPWRSRKRIVLAAAVTTLFLAEFFAAPITTTTYRVEIPGVDRWLAGRQPPFVVAEFPLVRASEQGEAHEWHSLYMLHSMAHWQKTIHGYSGIRPLFHRKLYSDLMTFPDEKSLNGLLSTGVTYVVVHPHLYPAGEWPDIQDRLRRMERWLTLEHSGDGGYVYSLRRPADSPAAR